MSERRQTYCADPLCEQEGAHVQGAKMCRWATTQQETPPMKPTPDEIERVARAIATRRKSKVVQHFHRADATAALTAMDPERLPEPATGEVADLIRRLRATEAIGMLTGSCDTVRLINRDGPEAADLITSLREQVAARDAEIERLNEKLRLKIVPAPPIVFEGDAALKEGPMT